MQEEQAYNQMLNQWNCKNDINT